MINHYIAIHCSSAHLTCVGFHLFGNYLPISALLLDKIYTRNSHLKWETRIFYLVVNSISRSHFICKTPLSAFVSSYIKLCWSYKHNSIPRLHFISGEGSMFLTVPQQHLWIRNVLSKVGLLSPQKLDFNIVCVLYLWQNYRFSSLCMYDDF